MIAKTLRNHLEERGVRYRTIAHSPAFTAQGAAHRAHIHGRQFAKTVVVFIDGNPAMMVLPADQRIGVQNLRTLAGTEDIRLAHEDEFRSHFPDCELGALPPFGNLYDMPTYAAPELAECEEIIFNAGNHAELVRMRWSDYEEDVQPRIAAFTA